MSDAFVTGQRLGDYEILGVLGAGGMGTVYKVRNVISDRIEAMKVLLANLADQKELADRFLREIKLLASLDHPNIAALRTALTLDNQLVMMMEYVEGVTLATRLQQGPIPAADAVNYTDQLLSALSYAHQLNVIHRDVKPANMMLTPQGVVKLMDFGIARPNNDAGMTATGTTLGSLNYMSPEQVRGEPVDARSDLYSLGVSLYEMVTGQLPFRGNSHYSIMSAHLQDPPKPPIVLRSDLPKGLNDIILMAMAKEPQRRFQSAEAFGNALKSALPGVGTHSAVPIPVSGTQRKDVNPIPAPVTRSSTPVVSPSMQPVSAAVAPRSSHRGMYMALGGLLVVGGLVAAGFYVPRRVKTQASPNPTSSQAPLEPASPPPTQLEATPPASTTDSKPPAQSAGDTAAAQAGAAAAKKEQEEAAEEAKKRAAELAEAEQQSDQLTSRAAAASQSLDNLRRAQSSQGFGLRGDITAAEELMKTNLSRGQSALEQKDGAKAKTYLDLAEAQVEKIEKFLGR
jgi:eukaryotic-like serine/threonine-protein kinase